MDKKEYISRQLIRTHNKRFENYCITRIFHKLDRLDVQFITQQLFYRDGGIALADLYLPQINLIVEVDEGQHKNAQEQDNKRTDEIIKNKMKAFEEIIHYDLKVERIDVTKDIETINQQIHLLVEFIKSRIEALEYEKKFVPWTGVYRKPEYYIKREFIDLEDSPSFPTIQEVSELFNKGYLGTQLAYFEDTKGSNVRIWCPQLQMEGQETHVPYMNEISEDGCLIKESVKASNYKDNRQYMLSEIDNNVTRIVFAKYRDSIGQNMYRFRGVFTLDREESLKQNKRVWVRTGTRHDLTKYFPT